MLKVSLLTVFTMVAAVVIAGPKVTIIGDSYSTYVGYSDKWDNTAAYNGSRYGVASVEHTYWWRVIQRLGGTLEKNNSWTGSCVSSYEETAQKQSMINPERLGNLGNPDLILICGGTNDSWKERPIGENVYHENLSEYTDAEKGYAASAMCYLLHYLKVNFPDAEIVVVINSYDDGWMGQSGQGYGPGIKQDICEKQAEAARHFGVIYVQLHDIAKDPGDGGHPNSEGMYAMSEQILDAYARAHVPETAADAAEVAALVETGDESVRAVQTADGIALVFAKPTAARMLTAKQDIRVKRMLLVGGGGAGGWTIGGGGGGGAVCEWVADDLPDGGIILTGDSLVLTVAEGGKNPHAPTWVTTVNDETYRQAVGLNGGDTQVKWGETTLVAAGGGGGGSWNNYDGAVGANGGGGVGGLETSGNTSYAGSGGTPLSGGNAGGSGAIGATLKTNAAGGGGGADGVGEDAKAGRSGAGGAAKISDILGYFEYFGGGGGGGAGNNTTVQGTGGANAGDGAPAIIGVRGRAGRAGFGGGGGGGGFTSSTDTAGGDGGSGTVILLVESARLECPSVRVAVGEVAMRTAAVTIDLASVGVGAVSAELYFAVAREGEEEVQFACVQSGVAAGSYPQALTELESATTYVVYATATNDLGEGSAIITQRFATLPAPDDFGTLVVASAPAEYGEVEPAYGTNAMLTAGEEVACSAPATVTVDPFTATCTGYKLYRLTGGEWVETAAGTERELDYVPQKGVVEKLEWQWTVTYDSSAGVEYVTENLVAWWDGKENQGMDSTEFSSSITVWKDKIANYSINLTGATIGDDYSVGFTGEGASSYGQIPAAVRRQLDAALKNGTIEAVVCAETVAGDVVNIIYQSAKYVPALGWNIENASTPYFCCFSATNLRCFNYPATKWYDELNTVAVCYNANEPQTGYVNGEGLSSDRLNGFGNGVEDSQGGWIARRSTGASGFKGKIYALRFYSARLTAEELAQNRAADEVRYGGKSSREDGLSIIGSPLQIGKVAPAYGTAGTLADGERVVCTASAQGVQDGKAYLNCGWTHYQVDGEGAIVAIATGTGTTCEFAHTGGMQDYVEWRWQEMGVLDSAAAYVQTGLVACWDAIENQGRNTGAHDDQVTAWKDVIGDRVITLTGAAFSGDHVTFTGEGASSYGKIAATDATGIYSALKNGTIEAVFQAEEPTGSQSIFILYQGKAGEAAIVWCNDGYVGGKAGTSNDNCYMCSSAAWFGGFNTIALGYNNSSFASCHLNGESLPTYANKNSFNSPYADGSISIARRSNGNDAFKGKLYCLRVYDHRLTDEELAQNRMVDRARFLGEGRIDRPMAEVTALELADDGTLTAEVQPLASGGEAPEIAMRLLSGPSAERMTATNDLSAATMRAGSYEIAPPLAFAGATEWGDGCFARLLLSSSAGEVLSDAVRLPVAISNFEPVAPVVDKEAKTVHFEGAIDPAGGMGTTTLTLRYGPSLPRMTREWVCGQAEQGGAIEFSKDLDCSQAGENLHRVAYAYELVQRLGGQVIHSETTVTNRLMVVPPGWITVIIR